MQNINKNLPYRQEKRVLTSEERQILDLVSQKIKLEEQFMELLRCWKDSGKVSISVVQAKELDNEYSNIVMQLENTYGRKCYSGHATSFEAIAKKDYKIALKSGNIDFIIWAMDKI